MSFEVTREELVEAFSAAGKVVDVKVPVDRETGKPRGFAFVQFDDDEAAERSIASLNGRSLRGRPMRVNAAEDRPPRAPGSGPGPRPSFGQPRPGSLVSPPPDFFGQTSDFEGRGGRPFKSKGSRRNIRRRKRGFD